MSLLSIPKININLWELKNKKILEKSEKVFNSFAKKNIKYNFKHIHCPCGSKKKTKLVKTFYELRYQECNCGTIFINPTLSDMHLNKIYKNKGIYEKHRREILFEKKSKSIRNLSNKRKILQILKLIKNNKYSKILDFGCGDGELLNSLSKNLNKDNLFGFDLNSNIKTTKNKIKIFSKFSEIKLQKFKLISLWGVLEHVREPKKLISFLTNRLEKGGYLVLEIPSSDSLLAKFTFSSNEIPIRWLEPYRHLFFFSYKCLKKIFEKRFKIEFVESNGLDLQTIYSSKNIFNEEKLIQGQKIINNLMLADHYRIFLKKK